MGIDKILTYLGILVSIIISLIGGYVSLITARKTEEERDAVVAATKRTDIDAAQILTNSNILLLKPLNEKLAFLESKDLRRDVEIAQLRIKSNKLEEENYKFKQVICNLINQLKDNRIIPVWNDLDCTQLLERQ